ncbi:RNA recognition motif-containing protein [Taxawa tesnikishii (nom. ined.)]|nr:RNA recognition motif-containing protein [Dothideales sp. JES 119]
MQDWEDENEDEDGELGSEDEEDMEDGLDEDEDDDFAEKNKTEDKSSTLFVRNLPFSCTDEDLEDHFTQFGSVRYARIVIDHATERPRGTGFVCFYKKEDAEECLKGAPRQQAPKPADKGPKGQVTHSILQNEDNDPSGKYTLESRVLQVAPAVNKSEATRLREEGVAYRNHRDRDKRRLYLLSEGTIPSNSPQYEKLSPSERTMREASMKQRKNLIESNPSLHLSLTRLSVRNIPRSVTSKDLKQLAREAVVGFATDVKAGKRQRLSKEELARGGEEMQEAEKDRRSRAKGLVKQAKIVFEGREGSKVDEKSGAGRSRGYGFIEYYTHRNALMGLRWLNGHAIDYSAIEKAGKGKKLTQEVIQDRKKRLIVEFAIENAQVVGRRKEREGKAKERAVTGDAGHNDARTASGKGSAGQKRKRGGGGDDEASQPEPPVTRPMRSWRSDKGSFRRSVWSAVLARRVPKHKLRLCFGRRGYTAYVLVQSGQKQALPFHLCVTLSVQKGNC